MMRHFLAAGLVVLAACALAQKKPSPVGTWVIPKTGKRMPDNITSLRITFTANGKMFLKSNTVTAEGKYVFTDLKGTMQLTKRNGTPPKTPRESMGRFSMSPDGQFLFLDGASAGSPRIRLVREPQARSKPR